ncbi:MAG: class I SAM-dependent rRNA methyltransferase [Anaerolineae bacterium]|jgi:23S rRNA (cytosine1962-C5)-methyltransferase
MAEVWLKRGRERSVLNRHPWLFSGAVHHLAGEPQPGDLVTVRSATGEALGVGYYNPRSQIVVRLLAWAEREIDAALWRERLQAAIARRGRLAADESIDCYRLVYAEADDLPGLVVDRYGEWLVLQALTLGIDRRKRELAALLLELTGARGVYERSDVDVRPREGLDDVTGPLAGETPPAAVRVRENGLLFEVDLAHGQKTGLYLDQRVNRQRVAAYCGGARVLNAFSYTGGFAVYAGGVAAAVVNLDSSEQALAAARVNWELNGLPPERLSEIKGDAFVELRRLRDRGEQYDVVILDPPKFAFSQAQVQAAARGYKDINMLGLRLLRPGGFLATFSCSGAIDEGFFLKILHGAALDVGREVRVLERLAQGPDHPLLLSFPEAAYLKGVIAVVS